MRLFPAASIVLIVTCVISLPVAAQIPSNDLGLGVGLGVGGTRGGRRVRYSVSGTVFEAGTDRAVDFVEVKLWNASGLVASTSSSSGGNFTFSDVPGGNYSLIVEEKGYQRLQEDIMVSGGPALGVRLALVHAYEKIGDGPTVSAREMAIPRRAREAMSRGLSLANDKSDYKGSIAQFQRAVKEYPGYYEAYTQMGISYTKMGDAAKSEEMLRKAIDMSQRKYPDALFTLAFEYSNQKRFADAEPLAREASQLDSGSWEASLELARALYGLERFDEAEASGLEAARLQPDNPQIHLTLANIHLKLRDPAALLHDLDNYLQLSPKGPEADRARKMRAQIAAAMAGAQSATP